MARKRHGGLGRGLDALIPQARPKERIEREQRAAESSEPVSTERTIEKTAETITETAQKANADGGYISGSTGTQDQVSQDQAVQNQEAQNQVPQDQKVQNQASQGQEAQNQAPQDQSDVAESADNTGFVSNTGYAGGSAAENNAGSSESAENTGSMNGDRNAGISAAEENGNSTAPGNNAGVPEKADSAVSGEVRMLRLSQVDPNRSQPRRKFADETLEELAESIRQFGVLQPILVQKKGSRYEIIAGERRWRASRKAGLREIPAIVREYSNQETLELSLIENIQREDLNPIEEAGAYRRLLDEFGMRQEDLAERVSKSRTAITNSLRLLKLEERVQDMLIREELSMGHARALLPVEIPEEQVLLAQEIVDRHLSVREVEKLVKSRLSGKSKKKDSKKKKDSAKDPALELAYRSIEERLKQSLGTKAVIHGGADGTGRIEIDFYSHEDLEKIIDLLT